MKGMSGKALVIRRWQDHGATRDEFVRWYLASGFDWVMLIGGGHTSQVALDPDLIGALRAAGIPWWSLWTLPDVDAWKRVLPDVVAFAALHGAQGVVLNPEREWFDQPEAAGDFAAEARVATTDVGLRLGFASYVWPTNMPAFPWSAFTENGDFDFGMPLCFDRNNDADDDYFVRAAREWRALGFDTLVPMGSLWANSDQQPKSANALHQHLAMIPPTPGVAFWYAQGAIDGQVLQVLGSWHPRSVVPLAARFFGLLADAVFGG
jgi:hypothetical protein